jgi:hypothetical protein
MSHIHLDSNRIRQMGALRRGAIRSRSYCVIALGGCVVGAAEFEFYAWRRWPRPVNARGVLVAMVYVVCGAGLLLLGRYFFRLAMRFHREARQSNLPPPQTPPDFSQLSDGSQIVKNLEEIS